jgi:hypothetical protein
VSFLESWFAVCGGSGDPAAQEEVYRVLRGFADDFARNGRQDAHIADEAATDVLMRFFGRRQALLQKVRASASPSPALWTALGVTGVGPAAWEQAFGRPLTPAEAAALAKATMADEGRLTAYLRRTVRNAVIDVHRKRVRQGFTNKPRGVDIEWSDGASTPGGRLEWSQEHEHWAQDEVEAAADGPEPRDALLEAADARWRNGVTQKAFAAWRAQGQGPYRNQPQLVVDRLRVLEVAADLHAAPGLSESERRALLAPLQQEAYRRGCHRLRAQLCTFIPMGDIGTPWPAVRLAQGELDDVVRADVFIACERLRVRSAAQP